MSSTCGNCGTIYQIEMLYCAYCGAAVNVSEEDKQSAVEKYSRSVPTVREIENEEIEESNWNDAGLQDLDSSFYAPESTYGTEPPTSRITGLLGQDAYESRDQEKQHIERSFKDSMKGEQEVFINGKPVDCVSFHASSSRDMNEVHRHSGESEFITGAVRTTISMELEHRDPSEAYSSGDILEIEVHFKSHDTITKYEAIVSTTDYDLFSAEPATKTIMSYELNVIKEAMDVKDSIAPYSSLEPEIVRTYLKLRPDDSVIGNVTIAPIADDSIMVTVSIFERKNHSLLGLRPPNNRIETHRLTMPEAEERIYSWELNEETNELVITGIENTIRETRYAVELNASYTRDARYEVDYSPVNRTSCPSCGSTDYRPFSVGSDTHRLCLICETVYDMEGNSRSEELLIAGSAEKPPSKLRRVLNAFRRFLRRQKHEEPIEDIRVTQQVTVDGPNLTNEGKKHLEDLFNPSYQYDES